MAENLCMLVCRNCELEAREVIALEGHDDVSVVVFPDRCDAPLMSSEEWDTILDANDGFDHVAVVGGFCLAHLKDCPEPKGCSIHRTKQCFHLFADQELSDNCMSQGSYLMTPGWLKQWRQRISTWGFDQGTAREFFSEFSRQLLLLDTGIHPTSHQDLKEMGEFVDLPFKVLPVGLGHFRSFINKVVTDWRQEFKKSKPDTTTSTGLRKQLSEYAMLFEMMSELSQTHIEEAVIQKIIDTFTMLFAPQRVIFLPLANGVPGKIRHTSISPLDETGIINRLMALDRKYAWTPSEKGFQLRITHREDVLGVLEVDEIALPEYKTHYLNLALNIIDVCGLSIDNARKYERIQASLTEKETLLQEIHHRVKNNLNVVSSLLKLQANKVDDERVKAALMVSQDRIHSMSSIHEMLYQSEKLSSIDLKGYLSLLAETLAENYSLTDKVALKIRSDDIKVTPKEASPIGLIINELVTNSFKYGFPGDMEGEINIDLQKKDSQVELVYSDDGVGVPDNFDLQKTKSMGLSLVKSLSEHQLSGSIDLEREGGTRFIIRFNIDSGS